MRDDEIDDVLKRAADSPGEVDPAVIERIARGIGANLQPVRPLPPAWVLRLILAAVCTATALASGALLGMRGFEKMTGVEAASLFAALAALVWLGGGICVSEMIPGSRRPVSPGRFLTAVAAAMTAAFAWFFRDYHVERFVAQGIPCLTAGLAVAVPAAAASWLVIRRGMAIDRPAAGMAFGILGGLSGLAMLELHCPNSEAAHVMVWHTAVPLLSALLGMAAGRLRR